MSGGIGQLQLASTAELRGILQALPLDRVQLRTGLAGLAFRFRA